MGRTKIVTIDRGLADRPQNSRGVRWFTVEPFFRIFDRWCTRSKGRAYRGGNVVSEAVVGYGLSEFASGIAKAKVLVPMVIREGRVRLPRSGRSSLVGKRENLSPARV